jgi:hypothetical protein
MTAARRGAELASEVEVARGLGAARVEPGESLLKSLQQLESPEAGDMAQVGFGFTRHREDCAGTT